MKPAVLLLIGTIFVVGCSSVREDPDDSFAPRPENAKSESYMVVRLGEERESSGIRKHYLLDMIKKYRERYAIAKSKKDIGMGNFADEVYNEYLKKVETFKSSDLDAAEAYIKSLPDSLKFISDDDKNSSRQDKAHKGYIVDFYGQYYSDDWSAYAFVINMIPTAKNGYVKIELDIAGEKLFFRKKARKKIWRIFPEYFWIHVELFSFENSNGHAPVLISISDPNDRGDMNGIYLVMPRSGVSGDTSVIREMRIVEGKAKLDPNYIPPEKLDYGSYKFINKDTIDGAEYVYEQRSSGAEDMEVYRYLSANWKTIGKDMNVRVVLDTYKRDPELFRQRIEEVRRRVPRTEPKVTVEKKAKVKAIVKTGKSPKVESGSWSIINEDTYQIADIVQGILGRRKTAEEAFEYLTVSRKIKGYDELIKKLIKLCQEDRQKFKSVLSPYLKK